MKYFFDGIAVNERESSFVLANSNGRGLALFVKFNGIASETDYDRAIPNESTIEFPKDGIESISFYRNNA